MESQDKTHEECDCSKLKQLQWLVGSLVAGFGVFCTASIPAYIALSNQVVELRTTVRAIVIPPPWFAAKVERLEREVEKLEEDAGL